MVSDQTEPTPATSTSPGNAEPASPSEPFAAISATTVPQTITQGVDASGMITKVDTPDTIIVIERSDSSD